MASKSAVLLTMTLNVKSKDVRVVAKLKSIKPTKNNANDLALSIIFSLLEVPD